MLLTLSIVMCLFPLSADTETQYASENSAVTGLNEHSNVLKVKADYVVTVKDAVKVYYKVRKKVKVQVKVKYKKRENGEQSIKQSTFTNTTTNITTNMFTGLIK